jgi:hypothetical protein
MSTFENSYINLRTPQSELLHAPVQGSLTSASEQDWQGKCLRQPAKNLVQRCVEFVSECWETMAELHAEFKYADSEIGERSRERTADRLRDEQAWLQLDDDGCPASDALQPPAVIRLNRQRPDLTRTA